MPILEAFTLKMLGQVHLTLEPFTSSPINIGRVSSVATAGKPYCITNSVK